LRARWISEYAASSLVRGRPAPPIRSSPCTRSWLRTWSLARRSSSARASGARPARNRIQTEVSTRTTTWSLACCRPSRDVGAPPVPRAPRPVTREDAHTLRAAGEIRARGARPRCRCWRHSPHEPPRAACRRCEASSSYGRPCHMRTSSSTITRPRRRTRPRSAAALPPTTRRTPSTLGYRLEPPARGVERDGLERLRHDGIGAAVRAGDDPAPALESIDLERALQRIDDPEMAHTLAGVDPHLPPAI